MKQVNNNWSIALTFGVPVAATLLGLLWLISRKRDQNDTDEDKKNKQKKDAPTKFSHEQTKATTSNKDLTSKHNTGESTDQISGSGESASKQSTLTEKVLACAISTSLKNGPLYSKCKNATGFEKPLICSNKECGEPDEGCSMTTTTAPTDVKNVPQTTKVQEIEEKIVKIEEKVQKKIEEKVEKKIEEKVEKQIEEKHNLSQNQKPTCLVAEREDIFADGDVPHPGLETDSLEHHSEEPLIQDDAAILDFKLSGAGAKAETFESKLAVLFNLSSAIPSSSQSSAVQSRSDPECQAVKEIFSQASQLQSQQSGSLSRSLSNSPLPVSTLSDILSVASVQGTPDITQTNQESLDKNGGHAKITRSEGGSCATSSGDIDSNLVSVTSNKISSCWSKVHHDTVSSSTIDEACSLDHLSDSSTPTVSGVGNVSLHISSRHGGFKDTKLTGSVSAENFQGVSRVSHSSASGSLRSLSSTSANTTIEASRVIQSKTNLLESDKARALVSDCQCDNEKVKQFKVTQSNSSLPESDKDRVLVSDSQCNNEKVKQSEVTQSNSSLPESDKDRVLISDSQCDDEKSKQSEITPPKSSLSVSDKGKALDLDSRWDNEKAKQSEVTQPMSGLSESEKDRVLVSNSQCDNEKVKQSEVTQPKSSLSESDKGKALDSDSQCDNEKVKQSEVTQPKSSLSESHKGRVLDSDSQCANGKVEQSISVTEVPKTVETGSKETGQPKTYSQAVQQINFTPKTEKAQPCTEMTRQGDGLDASKSNDASLSSAPVVESAVQKKADSILLEKSSETLNQRKQNQTPVSRFSNQRRSRAGVSRREELGPPEAEVANQVLSDVIQNGRLPGPGSPNSEGSTDSGRGGSVAEGLAPLSATDVVQYEFNFPSELCGRLIGRGGKNIHHIMNLSGAEVSLSSNPFTAEFQICHVQGVQSEVDHALSLIRQKFPLSHFPRLDMAALNAPPPAPVILPEVMQMVLPEGVSLDVVVSAVVNAGHIFIQQPTHPSFRALERLSQHMNDCYKNDSVPTLPRPVEGGIICAAESEGLWYRAQIVLVDPDADECDIKFVDFGGYTRVPINSLKQIRSDFMSLSFQAIECYMANITPLQDEEYYSDKANDVLMDLTSGKMLQGQVVARAEDGVSYVHLYQVTPLGVVLINRELANREVVRWVEMV